MIDSAMDAAISLWNDMGAPVERHLRVHYKPGVPTAQATASGDIDFGTLTRYMNKYTALHEISHTLGVGTERFHKLCRDNAFFKATDLLHQFDGNSSKITCGGPHFWPYGLNYPAEYSKINAERHIRMIKAMLEDGM